MSPKVQLTKQAYDKLRAYVALCPYEISGLGKVGIVAGNFVVYDIELFKQKVSGVHSDIDPRSLAEFQANMVRKGESMKHWTLWWHSHVNMAVFWSSTDTGTMDTSTEFPYLVSLVTNKRGEFKARLDVHTPVHLVQDNLKVEVLTDDTNEFTELCQAEIAAKVEYPAVEKYEPHAGFRTASGRKWQVERGETWGGRRFMSKEREEQLREEIEEFEQSEGLPSPHGLGDLTEEEWTDMEEWLAAQRGTKGSTQFLTPPHTLDDDAPSSV